MNANAILDIVSRNSLEDGIEILADEISELKEKLEILENKQKELMAEAGDGFTTSGGRRVSRNTRRTKKVDLEMFFMTDKDKYMAFANEGKLTVPASCIRELDEDSPYISETVSEFYTLKGNKND